MTSELDYRIAFDVMRRGNAVGAAMLKLQGAFESLEDAWNASESELIVAGLPADQASAIASARNQLDLPFILDRIKRLDITPIPHGSPDYPDQLAALEDPPNVLYVLGKLRQEYLRGVSIVGTRACSEYGARVAKLLATDLAKNGVAVISDLERGIDSIAARAAFDAGGHVVAVMAGGLDRFSPSANRSFIREVLAAERGCVVSEQPPGQASTGTALRQRNRITSALGHGLLVVEAPKRSGTMYSVRHALDRGIQVYAVPGKVTSPTNQGTNWLIQQGTKPVTRAGDILQDLDPAWQDLQNEDPEPRPATDAESDTASEEASAAVRETAGGAGRKARAESLLQAVQTDDERTIAETLIASNTPLGIDEISRECSLAVDIAGASLSIMEIRGLVRRVGTRYALASNREPAFAPPLV